MKILVTGAAGFIGSHIAQRLEKRKDVELILIDDFSRGKIEYLEYLGVKTKCKKIDVRNYNKIEDATKNVDCVYHTACRIGGVQFLHGSAGKELGALQENLTIDRNVFKACVKNNVKKVIYTSSISVYNTEKQYEKNAIFSEEDLEKQKLDPEGGYGWSKYIGERQLDMMKEIGIKIASARIFKSYGPCDDYSKESGQVVCSLCRKAINYPKEDFILWGDGTITRCLVYIDDLIDALMKIEEKISEESLMINLGGNRPISMKELAEKIIDISGKDIKIKYDTDKPTGPLSRKPNLNLAKEKLNWEPTTSLEEGLKKTYRWMEKTLKKA